MKRILPPLLAFLIPFSVFGTSISVRILTTKVITSFIVSPVTGSYRIYGDGSLLTETDASGIFQLTLENDSIVLKSFEKTLGKFGAVKLISQQADGVFKIKSVVAESKVRTYEDDIYVGLTADHKQLQIVNKVDIEKYIGGVVESESGSKTSPEYYKLQAILCRTYLLAHINRHSPEGFQVCDDVHCQAYLSRTVDSEIRKSVDATKGQVVVDNDLNLITAAFHSNCGGETVASQDVWAVSTSYLKSVKDTFCLHQPHAHWKRAIPTEDWKAYLQLKHKYPVDDSLKFFDATSFTQGNGRAIFFTDKDLKIPLKTIRADFQLKSTYFSIEQQGESVIFEGRGYGHGVGLCQEGAMRMADLKYSYKEILNFYYHDVHLVDLSALSYFRQE
ncbi:MAG: SpoIID/LytB domain-containing protein [Bacteroidia bacterium]